MSPTHSQRVNIMSEVLWFRTLRMYFIPLFPTTKAWEVYQENTCAFSFFSITSVIDHWQGFGAGPLCWVRSPAHRGNWAAWLHTRSCRLLSEQEIGFKGQKMIPCTLKPPTLDLRFWFHSSARSCYGLGAALQVVLTLVCNPSDPVGAVHLWAVQAHAQQKQICPCLP